jgi:hypothetical protein
LLAEHTCATRNIWGNLLTFVSSRVDFPLLVVNRNRKLQRLAGVLTSENYSTQMCNFLRLLGGPTGQLASLVFPEEKIDVVGGAVAP